MLGRCLGQHTMAEIEDVGPVRSIVQDGADSPFERLAPDKKSQRVEIALERYLRVDRGKSGGRVDADSMQPVFSAY